ncbi:hypothetical protein EON81_18675 [bacterium]|nr:MAG: hypothetical protein EON81_18675 [bacterium]
MREEFIFGSVGLGLAAGIAMGAALIIRSHSRAEGAAKIIAMSAAALAGAFLALLSVSLMAHENRLVGSSSVQLALPIVGTGLGAVVLPALYKRFLRS